MPISVTDPISQAIGRAKLITFQPFNIGKWFALGFCAFLASLDEGGGGNFNSFNSMRGGGSGTRPRPPAFPGAPIARPPANPFDEFTAWMTHNVGLVVLIAALSLVLFFALALLLMWINSRGKFMFIDGVAKNTAEVIAPWKRYRRLANSYLLFRICLMAISFVAMGAIAGIALLLAWHDIQAKTFGSGAIGAIVVGGLLIVPTFLILGIIQWAANSFVTVIMYARDITVMPAWRDFRQNVLAGNLGSIVLFLLMSIVVGIVVAMARALLGCLTLCIGFLPYLSSVITLPFGVFSRAYSIYFLQQFGPQYQIIVEPPPSYGFPVMMPPVPPPIPPALG